MSSVINQTKCILLHSYIPGKEQLLKSINCNSLEHEGFPCAEWIDTFFNNNLATLSNLTQFAFMYDNNGRHMSLFPRDAEYFGELFTYFLNKLVALNNGIIIDIITCNINTDQQKARIAALETQFNIDIRYSLNETGDYNKGGDWLMESDNVNIKDTYFNANINNWNHVLAFSTIGDYPEHVFDVSGKRVIFWTDISGNEVNPVYDASDNVIPVPNGRLINKTAVITADKVHAVLEDSSVSLWTNPVRMKAGNHVLYENGTCVPSTGVYYNENNLGTTVQLTNLKYIWGSGNCNAGLKYDGSCVIWGSAREYCTLQLYPSNTYVSVSAQLQSGVVYVAITGVHAAAALKSDGSVVTWGRRDYAGSMSYPYDVSAQLQSGVKMIVRNTLIDGGSVAALKLNGSVVTFGGTYGAAFNGDVSGQVQRNIKMIYPMGDGYMALTNTGRLIGWGSSNDYGTNITAPIDVSASLQSNVVSFIRDRYMCAALKSTGEVITWSGNGSYGRKVISSALSATSAGVSGQLQSGVIAIYPYYYGGAALKLDGSVVVWGQAWLDNIDSVSAQLSSGCVEIARSELKGFFIRKSNESVVIIGNATSTYLAPAVSNLFASNVKRVYKDDFILQYRDPVNEPNGGSLVLSGVPEQGSSIPIINTLISP